MQGENRGSATTRPGWSVAYALGPMLGDGISAKVFEAEACTEGRSSVENGSQGFHGRFLERCGSLGFPQQCIRHKGRRVAIKRFHRVGSRTFNKELSALLRVAVHPNVLRLLESYQGHGGEDVLILEYCDGSTLYDLYAREHPRGGLPERLIARLVHQLLLALEHLAGCGIEHQDVKPENMMLYDVSVSSHRGQLKLGDFGWAAIVAPRGGTAAKTPASGAGSLWYAPPELNPPVEGVTEELEPPRDAQGNIVHGHSDMWSVGVVLYLLLVGHNPFNVALKQPNQEAVDAEVLRLAALGQYNTRSERWQQLPLKAKNLIGRLLLINPADRPPACVALQDGFLTQHVPKQQASLLLSAPAAGAAEREAAWARLDGLQRLAWVAVARAVSEAELDRSVIAGALEGTQKGGLRAPREASYLFQLAKELGTTPVFHWLMDRSCWPDLLRISFCYLDLDGDGLLGPQDLVSHISRYPVNEAPEAIREGKKPSPSRGALSAANAWIARWADPSAPPATTASGIAGLPVVGFRDALLASYAGSDASTPGWQGAHCARLGCSGQQGDRPAGAGAPLAANGLDEEEITWMDMAHQQPREY